MTIRQANKILKRDLTNLLSQSDSGVRVTVSQYRSNTSAKSGFVVARRKLRFYQKQVRQGL